MVLEQQAMQAIQVGQLVVEERMLATLVDSNSTSFQSLELGRIER
jgi:hypothetical protein